MESGELYGGGSRLSGSLGKPAAGPRTKEETGRISRKASCRDISLGWSLGGGGRTLEWFLQKRKPPGASPQPRRRNSCSGDSCPVQGEEPSIWDCPQVDSRYTLASVSEAWQDSPDQKGYVVQVGDFCFVGVINLASSQTFAHE